MTAELSPVVIMEVTSRGWAPIGPGRSENRLYEPGELIEIEQRLVSAKWMTPVMPSDPPAAGEVERWDAGHTALQMAKTRATDVRNRAAAAQAKRTPEAKTAAAILKAVEPIVAQMMPNQLQQADGPLLEQIEALKAQLAAVQAAPPATADTAAAPQDQLAMTADAPSQTEPAPKPAASDAQRKPQHGKR